MKRLGIQIGLLILIGICAICFRHQLSVAYEYVMLRLLHKSTIGNRLSEYGGVVQNRLAADFARTNLPYPPKALALLAFKQEKTLEVWGSADDRQWALLHTYPIRAASGKLGPKLKKGDLQVPEGLYTIESLNPNSLFHLALRVGYPNAFDKEKARQDKRENLGSDIMIHGESSSIGCLAMGNEAAEDLFVLAAETGIDHLEVLIAPVDFRKSDLPPGLTLPAWTNDLYASIKESLQRFH